MAIVKPPNQIKNPLTLIAVFAGIAETVATLVLWKLDGRVQLIFVWYVMLFPFFLVGGFYYILYNKHEALYAPGDWKDEKNFVKILTGTYNEGNEDVAVTKILNDFWKPGGSVNKDNEKQLRAWIKSNGLKNQPLTFFLRNKLFADKRQKALADLNLAEGIRHE